MSIVSSIEEYGLLPVIQIADAGHARGLAKALVAGGLPIAEVTLRTPAALEAIRQMTEAFPSVLVGAGTVSSRRQVDDAVAAGARFVVSPGINPTVVERCLELEVPVIPGVCNPTDIELALNYGLKTLKFFPAEAAGGVAMLKALSGPYGHISFIPTGGINPANLPSYMSLSNVLACGGSWMVSPEDINSAAFDRIEMLVTEAMQLLSAEKEAA